MKRSDLLIADDDPFIVELLAKLASGIGAAFDTAYDGQQTLEKLRQTSPHVVLLDVKMPHVDGLQVCRAAREQPHLADTCIVMLSGVSTRADIEAALAAGADEYVTKPFSVRELTQRLTDILAERRGPAAQTRQACAGSGGSSCSSSRGA